MWAQSAKLWILKYKNKHAHIAENRPAAPIFTWNYQLVPVAMKNTEVYVLYHIFEKVSIFMLNIYWYIRKADLEKYCFSISLVFQDDVSYYGRSHLKLGSEVSRSIYCDYFCINTLPDETHFDTPEKTSQIQIEHLLHRNTRSIFKICSRLFEIQIIDIYPNVSCTFMS